MLEHSVYVMLNELAPLLMARNTVLQLSYFCPCDENDDNTRPAEDQSDVDHEFERNLCRL